MTHLSDDSLHRLAGLIDQPDLTGTKYRLIERIASGGMGSVFMVEDTELNRQVALKVLTVPDESAQLRVRMLREAQVLAALEHPAIVPIHDVGTLADSRPFYVMKYVQGQTLSQWLNADPSVTERITTLQRVCQAVAFAHSRKIIHRDIKPDNIMVGPFGEVLIMDWGTAKLLEPNATESQVPSDSTERCDSSATRGGTIIGTPAYMAPEQLLGHHGIDTVSDVFGLGSTMFFVMTGQAPFGVSPRPERTPRIRDVNGSLPKPLDAICAKAMATARAERYQTVESFESDLGHFLQGEPVSAYRENALEQAWRWLRRHQFVVLAVFAYIILRVVIFFWLGR